MKKFLKENYHWIVAAVVLLMQFIYTGLVNNFSGYHLIPVSEALNISRTQFAFANTLRSVAGIFGNLFAIVMSAVLVVAYLVLYAMMDRTKKKYLAEAK